MNMKAIDVTIALMPKNRNFFRVNFGCMVKFLFEFNELRSKTTTKEIESNALRERVNKKD